MELFKLAYHTADKQALYDMGNDTLCLFALCLCNTYTLDEMIEHTRTGVIRDCLAELAMRPETENVLLARTACERALGII